MSTAHTLRVRFPAGKAIFCEQVLAAGVWTPRIKSPPCNLALAGIRFTNPPEFPVRDAALG